MDVSSKPPANSDRDSSSVRPIRRSSRFANVGLQRRIVAYVAISLTALVAMFAYVALDAVDESSDAILRERLSLSATVAQSIDQSVAATDSLVNRAAIDLAAIHIEGSLSDAERTMLVSLGSSLADVNAGRRPDLVVLLDAGGNPVWGTGPAAIVGIQSLIASDSESPAILKGGGNSTAIVVWAQLPAAADLSFLIATTLPGEDFLGISSSADSSIGDYRLELLDESGTVIGEATDELTGSDSRHLDVIGSLASEREGGVGKHATDLGDGDSVDHVVAYAPLSSLPWGVVLEQPEDAALALPNDLRRRVLLISAGSLIGGLLLAWITTGQVVRPLTRLTTRARVLAGGDLSGPIPSEGQDEIRRLAESFEVMRGRLERSQHELADWSKELEDRVQDRTALLEQRDRERDVLLNKVISAQEEERKRIARDLHDQIGQTLTGLVMQLGSAEATIGGDADVARQQLAALGQTASDAVEEVRRMMADLRPSILDDMGLVSAISWYAESNLEREGVDITLDLQRPPSTLPPNVEISVFRVFQESITNIIKHAKADHVHLKLSYPDSRIQGEIGDNGVGFDVSGVEPGAAGGWAIGLLGMAERVGLLGGELSIDSTLGSGTTVKFQLPLTHGITEGSTDA
ncbi:MAG: HAMP domain-containing protein [Chloroflexi bacterium]|nr:HAMP domain-containing protein [Chloroflexota bacterium]